MIVFDLVVGLVLGAAGGSFFAAAKSRYKEGVKMDGRSHCPHCGKEIPGKYNIPIVSYLWLRGKSKCCGKSIPAEYFLSEIVGAAVGAALAYFWGPLLVAAIVIAMIGIVWIRDKQAS